jgi:hypothetical protein
MYVRDDGPHVTAEPSPKVENQCKPKTDRSALGSAFLMTMRRQAEGVLTEFLYGESRDQHIIKSQSYSVTNAIDNHLILS